MPRIASLVSSRPVWLAILLLTVSCGKSSPSVPSSTDSDDTKPQNTDPADASTDTETGSVDTVPPDDTDTDTVTTVTVTPELLYQFPTEERTASFGSMAVDDGYIYIQLSGAGLRAPKEGGGEITTTGISTGGGSLYSDILFDDTYVCWMTASVSGSAVHRTNKTTGESDVFDSADWDGNMLAVIAQDEESIYIAGYGCTAVVSMKKDGTERSVAYLERTGYESGSASIAVDDEYIYCGGGGDGSTRGKMYRSKKYSKSIEAFTSVTDLDDFLGASFRSQVGSILPTANAIFYINSFGSTNYAVHRLNSVSPDGGTSSILFETDDTGGKGRLYFNESRGSLYWLSTTVDIGKINRYAIDTGEIARSQDLPLSISPGAMDDEYFYWYMKDGIYRVPLF